MILDFQYIAGLFDGEGWFTINRLRCKKTKHGKFEFRYQPIAALVMREEWIVDSIISTVGGFKTRLKSRSTKHSPYFKWQVSGDALRAFLKAIGPFLLCKRAQANVVACMSRLKFQNGNKAIDQERYDIYTALHRELQELNKKGVGK